MDSADRPIVLQDLFVALASVVTATLTATAVEPAVSLWVGATAAVGGLALFAAADRTAVGARSLAVALMGAVLLFVVALWWLTDEALLSLVPPLLFGLGTGTGVNRLLFGVVYPLPAQRRERENAA